MVKRILNKSFLLVFPVITAALFSGCSASKFVPDGRFMLDDVRIESDTDGLHPDKRALCQAERQLEMVFRSENTSRNIRHVRQRHHKMD